MASRKSGTTTRTSARKATGSATRKGARGRHVASEVHDDELSPAPAGSQSLVIVESPAKAKTIGKYLGRGYRVRATVGHIMDLPEKKLGIDVEQDRKSTRLNSSHVSISYAVFCLKKKKKKIHTTAYHLQHKRYTA